MWNTLEIGIKFDKPTNIRAQLDKIENGGGERRPSKVPEPDRKSSLSREPFSPLAKQEDSNPIDKIEVQPPSDPTSRFDALRSFYKDQLAASASADPASLNSGAAFAYSSPSSIDRLLNLYNNAGTSLKKVNQKPTIMREALTPSEGLKLSNQLDGTSAFEPELYTSISSPSQRLAQNPSSIGNPSFREVKDLRPMPTILRTKRNKRCKECKHILIRPEFKPTSTRYRIKLIALNYIPLVSLRPLHPPGTSIISTNIDGGDVILEPAKPYQWILTLRNPLFDPVQVSLGTPSVTPGKYGHRVTILCPQFEIGANSDVWDDVLNAKDGKEAAASPGGGTGDQIAGKIYEKGKNWTSIVLEVVPASIFKMKPSHSEVQSLDEEEDEDVIEVPIRVRLDWKQSDFGGAGEKKKSEKLNEDGIDEGTRELAYWMVLGVGRVGMSGAENTI